MVLEHSLVLGLMFKQLNVFHMPGRLKKAIMLWCTGFPALAIAVF